MVFTAGQERPVTASGFGFNCSTGQLASLKLQFSYTDENNLALNEYGAKNYIFKCNSAANFAASCAGKSCDTSGCCSGYVCGGGGTCILNGAGLDGAHCTTDSDCNYTYDVPNGYQYECAQLGLFKHTCVAAGSVGTTCDPNPSYTYCNEVDLTCYHGMCMGEDGEYCDSNAECISGHCDLSGNGNDPNDLTCVS
jgi:hypothetical protein